MASFGFVPNDPDDSENSGENGGPDFEAMMRQMQEQMKAQFEQLGINPAGFVNPFAAFTGGINETLPKNVVRDTAKKTVQLHLHK